MIDGKALIDTIAKRLNYKGTPPHDSAIVHLIGQLSKGELMQLVHFGNLPKWHNEELKEADHEQDS